jgi:CBS domain-containing protein
MRAAGERARSGVGIAPDRTVADAAILMEQAGVGSLAVVDGSHRLLGIVTDRDLVRRALARGLPPDARIDAVMSTPVVTIDAAADVHAAYAVFHSNAVRRLAVVSGATFVGMLSIDDLLVELAGDLSDLSRPIVAEAVFAQHDSPVPAVN